MDKPKLREILEKVYSCEVESDAKDKKRILNQAEAEINALYSPLTEEEIEKVIDKTNGDMRFRKNCPASSKQLALALYPHL